MKDYTQVDIYIRFSKINVVLDKVATLNVENELVYQDEGGGYKAHLQTLSKFTLLALSSPLIATARIIRSIGFFSIAEFARAFREFIGGIATPLITTSCLIGSLLSSGVYLISNQEMTFYITMRRTYAHFEAWINQIDLESVNLPSYSQRVSLPTDVVGNSKGAHKHVWTTAPCMQPILEKGESSHGGILDKERMKKIFPLLKINGIHRENGKIVIQSEYLNKNTHVVACNGACEQARISQTCCCCFRIDAAYDRVFCCEVGQGNCSWIPDSNQKCGISFCTVCGMGICCCHGQIDDASFFHANLMCPAV